MASRLTACQHETTQIITVGPIASNLLLIYILLLLVQTFTISITLLAQHHA